MLSKAVSLLFLVIAIVWAAKQCNERNTKRNLLKVQPKQQLTGKALVDHINKLGGTWKVCF
jgi:hypothetical protein